VTWSSSYIAKGKSPLSTAGSSAGLLSKKKNGPQGVFDLCFDRDVWRFEDWHKHQVLVAKAENVSQVVDSCRVQKPVRRRWSHIKRESVILAQIGRVIFRFASRLYGLDFICLQIRMLSLLSRLGGRMWSLKKLSGGLESLKNSALPLLN